MTIHIILNGQAVEAQEGQTILEVAQQNRIHIPTLCYHKDLSPTGNCRICVVEVKNNRLLQTACTTRVANGMEVETNSEKVLASRKLSLQLMLANHPQDCLTCDASGECELQDLAYEYQVQPPAWGQNGTRFVPDSDPNPFIRVDMNKCILCRRCVQACAEIQGRDVWHIAQRGNETKIVAGANTTMLEAHCESCGQCVAYCPTGALSNRMSHGLGRAHQIRKVTTTCPYCGVGCQFDLQVKEGRVIGVASNPNAPVNGMALCVKGRYGYGFIHHPDRLLRPRVRRYLLEGGKKTRTGRSWEWVETDWETALNLATRRLLEIRAESGPDSIGVLTSAKCLNEENYLMNKLARQVIGTNNIDHCARLCHASTVAGLTVSFGSGAMSNSMEDVAHLAQAFFVIGSNTTEQHPVFGTMLRRAVRFRGAKLVIADPRRIDLCDFATLHLRHKAGSDVALLNGLMYIILEKGWADEKFIAERTEGFDEFRQTVMQYPPEKVSEITGVPVAQLYQAAEILGTSKPMAVIWAMGITQHITGVRNVMSLANLQMLTGNMGIPGGGVNPLRGQNNVQGAGDMGGLPNVYPGYQPVSDEKVQQKFASAWGRTSNTSIGLTVTQMIPSILEGKIRALYILGEDPIMSDPDTGHIRKCLEQADFILLQEIFPSETSEYADILLAGVSFAEKTGTFTNTERRVQMVHKAIEPLGEARPDWQIIADLARRMLSASADLSATSAPFAGWDYADTDAIQREINALTPSYAGITHARLEKGERLQWPCPTTDHPGTPILHTQQFTRGLGKFAAIEHIPPAEWPDKAYPFVLNTGRVLYHWHGGEMTRRSQGLADVYDRPLIELNPEDARTLGVEKGGRVRVTSRRGSIEAEAWITDRVPAGMIFANFHFPQASANVLTHAALDPVAKIPEYKVSAVRIEKI
ncbi:MAG: formate dehydrogenase subunit alpha [Candidatus Villigracilaceae bacterium]